MMSKSVASDGPKSQTSGGIDKKRLNESSPSKLKAVNQKKDPPNVEFLLKQVYFAHRTKVKDLENSLAISKQLVKNLQEEIKGLKELVTNLKNDKDSLKLANHQLKHQLDSLSTTSKLREEGNSSSPNVDEMFLDEVVSKTDSLKLPRTKRPCLFSENSSPAKRSKFKKESIDSPIFVEKILPPRKIEFDDEIAETIFVLDTCDPDESWHQNVSTKKHHNNDPDVVLVPETLCIDNELFNSSQEILQKYQNAEEKGNSPIKRKNTLSRKYLKPPPHKCQTNTRKQFASKVPLIFEEILEKSAGNNSSLLNVSDVSPVLVGSKTIGKEKSRTDYLQKNSLTERIQQNNLSAGSSKAGENRFKDIIANLIPSPKNINCSKNKSISDETVNKNTVLVDIGNHQHLFPAGVSGDPDETVLPTDIRTEFKETKFSSIGQVNLESNGVPKGSPKYKYIEKVIRNHDERKKLQGFTCKECEQFYACLPEEERQKHLKNCSRHRAKFIPPGTPEHYWSIGFPNTAECLKRGYINQTQRKPLLTRRKRPLQKL